MKRRCITIAAVLCVAPHSWAAPPCLHYGGDPITLTGRVTFRTFYGPPNYGENPETDSRETQAILVMAKPICVDANPSTDEEKEKGQRKVTLVPSAGFNPPMYRGKLVTVEGRLFHAHTAHHRTPVLIQTVRIKDGHD